MTPSWDLFIVLFFVIMGVYGFLLGRSRVFTILINSYVGLVIATQLGSYAFDYLARATSVSHSFNVSMFGAKIFVFVAIIFILTLNKELSGSGDEGGSNTAITAIYGILAAGLILSSVFSFMGEAERQALFNTSTLAARVYAIQYAWLLGPILVVIVSNVVSRFKK